MPVDGILLAVILVLRALGLGDFLTAVPALRGLRRHFPDQEIVIAAPRELLPIVSLAKVVDKLVPTPSLNSFQWRGESPQLAVNLHGRGPISTAKLMGTRPKDLLTYRHPLIPVDGPVWHRHRHEIRRWCDLLAFKKIATDPSDLRLSSPPPWTQQGHVVIHPGAKDKARQWPPDRFAEVARGVAALGLSVVISGSPSERQLARQVADQAQLPESAIVAGEGLGELASLIGSARLVICGDTGPAHLATALGTPLIVLFGPTSPADWGPPPSDASVVLWAGTTGDPHGRQVDPGLLTLQPDLVLEQVDKLLQPKGAKQ